MTSSFLVRSFQFEIPCLKVYRAPPAEWWSSTGLPDEGREEWTAIEQSLKSSSMIVLRSPFLPLLTIGRVSR